MRKTYIIKNKKGEKKEIEISEEDQQAIECGAMRIIKDDFGTEHLTITIQLNPRWEEKWIGNKHLIKNEEGKIITAHKYLPIKYYEFLDKLDKEKKQKEITKRKLDGIIEAENLI